MIHVLAEAAQAPSVSDAWVAAGATVLVALIGLVPVLRSTRKASSAAQEAREATAKHGPTSEAILAGLNRLEGKVDVMRDDLREVIAWKVLHENLHSSGLVLADEAGIDLEHLRRLR